MEIIFYENEKGIEPAKQFIESLSNIRKIMKGGILMSTNFRDFLEEQLKDPEFAKEYYAIKPEVDFAIVIHRVREEKGLTQKELAKLCGVNQANISRIENGERLPNIYTIQRIANSLGMQLALVPME